MTATAGEGRSGSARLKDIVDLTALKERYCLLVDERRWEELADLFTPGCTFTSSVPIPAIQGPVEFVAFVRRTVEPGRSRHHVFLPEITFPTAGTAWARWPMSDRVELDDGRSGWKGSGVYRESYIRDPTSRWLIDSWHLHRLALDRLPDGRLRA